MTSLRSDGLRFGVHVAPVDPFAADVVAEICLPCRSMHSERAPRLRHRLFMSATRAERPRRDLDRCG